MNPFSDPVQEAAYQKAYREKNADRIKAQSSEWRSKNSEALKEKKRQDYERNKEAYKARAKASRKRRLKEIKAQRSTPEYKERRNALRRAKYIPHPIPPPKTREEILEDKKRYYQENWDRIREEQKAYYENNRVKWKGLWQKKPYWIQKWEHGLKKARKKQAEIVDLPSLKEFYRQVFDKHENTCQYCHGTFSIKYITVDHKQPFKLNGKHEVSNLAVSCLLCNLKKGIKPHECWRSLL